MSEWRRCQRFAIKIAILSIIIASCIAQESPQLGSLVPSIKTDNYELVPDGNQYRLRLSLPDGKNEREEVVELQAPGTAEQALSVKGTINGYFSDTGATLEIVYEAGKNGYVVKYKYRKKPTEAPLRPQFISPGGLKSSVG